MRFLISRIRNYLEGQLLLQKKLYSFHIQPVVLLLFLDYPVVFYFLTNCNTAKLSLGLWTRAPGSLGTCGGKSGSWFLHGVRTQSGYSSLHKTWELLCSLAFAIKNCYLEQDNPNCIDLAHEVHFSLGIFSTQCRQI